MTYQLLSQNNFQTIFLALESFFQEVKSLHDRDTHGGYFVIADQNGVPLMMRGIGKVHQEKIDKYILFAQEKARRLASYPDHQSSAQSRNPDQAMYAGAIRAGNLILSFSGLPEQLDEACMLGVAVMMRLLSHMEAQDIAAHWGNTEAYLKVYELILK